MKRFHDLYGLGSSSVYMTHDTQPPGPPSSTKRDSPEGSLHKRQLHALRVSNAKNILIPRPIYLPFMKTKGTGYSKTMVIRHLANPLKSMVGSGILWERARESFGLGGPRCALVRGLIIPILCHGPRRSRDRFCHSEANEGPRAQRGERWIER